MGCWERTHVRQVVVKHCLCPGHHELAFLCAEFEIMERASGENGHPVVCIIVILLTFPVSQLLS